MALLHRKPQLTTPLSIVDPYNIFENTIQVSWAFKTIQSVFFDHILDHIFSLLAEVNRPHCANNIFIKCFHNLSADNHQKAYQCKLWRQMYGSLTDSVGYWRVSLTLTSLSDKSWWDFHVENTNRIFSLLVTHRDNTVLSILHDFWMGRIWDRLYSVSTTPFIN
jgi:hypothetical protein